MDITEVIYELRSRRCNILFSFDFINYLISLQKYKIFLITHKTALCCYY